MANADVPPLPPLPSSDWLSCRLAEQRGAIVLMLWLSTGDGCETGHGEKGGVNGRAGRDGRDVGLGPLSFCSTAYMIENIAKITL